MNGLWSVLLTQNAEESKRFGVTYFNIFKKWFIRIGIWEFVLNAEETNG